MFHGTFEFHETPVGNHWYTGHHYYFYTWLKLVVVTHICFSVMFSSLNCTHIYVHIVCVNMESISAYNKRKPDVITKEQKIEILAKLDKGETKASLVHDFNTCTATVLDIKKTVMQSWILRRRLIMVVEQKEGKL